LWLTVQLHRGTYTSHGSVKRNNRKLEILLHDIELVATLASLPSSAATIASGCKHHGKSAYRYPKDKLDALWEDGAWARRGRAEDAVLLCQFHDVLPGSAINMVYSDAERVRSCYCAPLTLSSTPTSGQRAARCSRMPSPPCCRTASRARPTTPATATASSTRPSTRSTCVT